MATLLIDQLIKQKIVIDVDTSKTEKYFMPRNLYEAGVTEGGKIIGHILSGEIPQQRSSLATLRRHKYYFESKDIICLQEHNSKRTILKYMTHRGFRREFLADKNLTSYSVMIIDADIRTLSTDIMLGLAKGIVRSDLKLLIYSSSFDALKYSEFFDLDFKFGSHKSHVNIYYKNEPVRDYVHACAMSILDIIEKNYYRQNIVVFLPGIDEINACIKILTAMRKTLIYGRYSMDVYKFFPENYKVGEGSKDLLSCNVIFTTDIIDQFYYHLEQVHYIIDSGFENQIHFDCCTGTEKSITVPISKASANKRAHQIINSSEVKCFRMYPSQAYEEISDDDTPEIQRIDLSNLVLTLEAFGINNLMNFDFLDRPPPESIILALSQLYALEALNHRGEITKTGIKMADFPVCPMMAKMLLASERYQCSDDIVTIAAMLSATEEIFFPSTNNNDDWGRTQFHHIRGEHLTLVNIYNRWKNSRYSSEWCSENSLQYSSLKCVRHFRETLVRLMENMGIYMVSSIIDDSNIRKAITAGYFYHVAKQSHDLEYVTVKPNQVVYIKPHVALQQKSQHFVVYHKLLESEDNIKCMDIVTEIESDWLMEIASHYYKPTDLED